MKEKNIFKSTPFLQKNTFLPDVYNTTLDEAFPVLQNFTRRLKFQQFPSAKRLIMRLKIRPVYNY
jgi:hypothetical protein